MSSLRSLLPSSLIGRIFFLYLASLMMFVGSGLGLFYKYQFSQRMEEAQLGAEMMMNVAAQSVAESAVIGDYDTIKNTLERVIAQSYFSEAKYIDVGGGLIRERNTANVSLHPPQWLLAMVQKKLYDINHNIVVGGKDYGVLRISFAADRVSSELWHLAQLAFALALAALVAGMGVIWIPLQRWLGNFDRVRAQESAILSGEVDVHALLDRDAPVEISHTFSILSRAAGRLLAQREEAAVTLNAITDGVLTLNAACRVMYCNPAAQKMLELTGSSLIGQDIRTILPTLFSADAMPAVEQLRRIEMATGLGPQVILDATLSTLHASAEAITGYVLAIKDVTRQHILDQQLHDQLETRQRALESLHQVLGSFQAAPESGLAALAVDDLDALIARVVALVNERERGRRALDNQIFALDQHAIVSVTNLNGVITYVNERFCKISGYCRDELLGANHRIVRSGQHEPQFFEMLWQSVTQGHVWRGEICNRHKQGSYYWVDATIVPLMGRDGLPEQLIAIRTDITARKTVELQLEEQLRFVDVLLEAIPTAIYLKDTAGRYLRFNRAFEELFGIERSQWVGKNVFDLVPGEAAALMHAKDQELLQTRTIQTYEASFTNRQTDKVRDGLYWKALLTNHAGEVTGLVGTILDITERNRLNQELQQAKRTAEAASQSKSDFLANMSHEIRTPMNGVIGMTDLALATPLNATQHEYLSIVKSSAQALMAILNDILDFSKIEAGKLNIEAINFSPASTISDTLKTIVARAEKKGLALVCQLAPELPEQVCGDPGRIRQILTNLCDNAIKFTAQGGVTVHASCLPVAGEGLDLTLSVRDTGIGIPADKQQGVFEAFSQADTSTTRQYGGTGLGLTICARLAALMGGRIWVESMPGVGSTFHFTVRVQAVQQVSSVAVLPAPVFKKQVLRVLLVEDNPVNQMVCATFLNQWGHSVVLANNGQEAVDLFADQAWDIVLMDMQMPVMGGLEATRQIRASERPGQRTPIVAMTANAMESDRQACLDAGMDDHLAKPFNADTLRAMMERLCALPPGMSD